MYVDEPIIKLGEIMKQIEMVYYTNGYSLEMDTLMEKELIENVNVEYLRRLRLILKSS